MIKNIFDKLSDIEEQRQNEIAQQKKEGVPLVVYNSTFVPEEIIRAAGANTYLLCRGGESAPAAAAINDTLECINPLARASVSYITGKMDSIASQADLVVTAFSDSHMSRMSELLEYKGINVFKVGVPVDWQRSISFDYYLNSLRTMQRRVEELTGKKTDMELARDILCMLVSLLSILFSLDVTSAIICAFCPASLPADTFSLRAAVKAMH